MRKSVLSTVCLAGLAAAAFAGDLTRPGHFNDEGRFVPFAQTLGSLEFSGSLIVRVRQDLAQADERVARGMMTDLAARQNEVVDYYIVDAPVARGESVPGEAENALSESLMATGLFEYAVPNWICYPLETPNDPQYGAQWHHPQISSPDAWDITHGDASVIIAFTDTGVYKAHSDLAGKFVNGYDAYNNISEDDGGSVNDIHGHGTHVAGCAGAIGNNANGVAGVNWNVQLMMIRVAIDGGGGAYYEDLLEGAQWAIEHGAKIVSASYSGISYEPIQTMGAYIHSIGGIYMYAAGNDGAYLNFDWNDVIVVGASTYGDAKASFSAYGPAIDVFAPGVDIGSTTRDGGYGWWSGTSMATPVTNGVASMIWAADPSLTNLEVEQILFETCFDLGQAGNDSTYGWGRVDAGAAAQTAADGAGCIADWNDDGVVNTQDFIAYLGDWSIGCEFACPGDLNNDGSTDTQDFLIFLDAWANAYADGGC